MKIERALMNNRTYDTIKLISLLAVPVLAFIGALCTIWKVPHAEQITATLTAVDTLLGAIVIVLAKEYHKKLEKEGDDDESAVD